MVFRTVLCEFLKSIYALPTDVASGQVVLFTANYTAVRQKYAELINAHCGTNVKLYETGQKCPYAVLIDDHKGMAAGKLAAMSTKPPDLRNLTKWVQIKSFLGDLSDKELGQILPQVAKRAMIS